MNLEKLQSLGIYISIGVVLTVIAYIAINRAVSNIICEFLISDKLKQAIERKLQQLNDFNLHDGVDYKNWCNGHWSEVQKDKMAANYVKIVALLDHLRTVDEGAILGGLSVVLPEIHKRATHELEDCVRLSYRSVDFMTEEDYNKIIACIYPATPDNVVLFLTLRVLLWPLTAVVSLVRVLAVLLRWVTSKCAKSPFKE